MLNGGRGFIFIVGFAVFMLFQHSAYALAISEVKLNSDLNQRLSADILLLSATAEEIENLSLQIRRPKGKVANVSHWPNVTIEIIKNNNDEYSLHIASEQPVIEPVLNFTLELNWSGGRLLREYTLLIDPKLG